MKKENQTFENNQLIVLFMKSLDLKVNDMVKFLEVSANTVYNYRTLDSESLPSKVTSKLFDLLSVKNADEARNLLTQLDYDRKNILLGKLGKSITSKSMLYNDIQGNNMSNYSNGLSRIGSKVYVDALIHEIENVLKEINDYEFISYVKKYNKGEY